MPTPNLFSITTVTPTLLASLQLASGNNTIYTVPANKAAKLSKLVLSNVTGTAVVVSVSLIPSGGTVDGTHKVVSSYLIAANDSTIVSELEGVWVGAGDFISVNAAASTAIDAVLSGLVFA